MGGADLTFYSTGIVICLLIMAAAFAAAAFLFFRFRLMKNITRRTEKCRKAGKHEKKSEKRIPKHTAKSGASEEFRITEQVISVHTDHFI